MTALTLQSADPGHPASGAVPLPWRQMAWVIWRQHRAALLAAAVLLGALTVGVWIAGLHLRHTYTAATSCHPADLAICAQLSNVFDTTNDFLANGLLFQAVPALLGAFVAAPVLARELETGTYRYAWTQGFGRCRWAMAKLATLAALLVAATALLGTLLSWYYRPYFPTGNQRLGLTELSPLAPNLFDLRDLDLAAWTLAAFSIGALAGVLARRVVPAIVATLAVYAGLAFATGLELRQHYLAPVVTSRLHLPGSAWVLRQTWTTRSGGPVSQQTLVQVLQAGGPTYAGKGGIPEAPSSWQYLVDHGYVLWTIYQPASRFWPFQWIEGGSLLVLSALLLAATVRLVRRQQA